MRPKKSYFNFDDIIEEKIEDTEQDLENMLQTEKLQKEVGEKKQLIQQMGAQAEKANPKNWTVEQTQKNFKDSPAQTPQEEAQREALLKSKKEQRDAPIKAAEEKQEELKLKKADIAAIAAFPVLLVGALMEPTPLGEAALAVKYAPLLAKYSPYILGFIAAAVSSKNLSKIDKNEVKQLANNAISKITQKEASKRKTLQKESVKEGKKFDETQDVTLTQQDFAELGIMPVEQKAQEGTFTPEEVGQLGETFKKRGVVTPPEELEKPARDSGLLPLPIEEGVKETGFMPSPLEQVEPTKETLEKTPTEPLREEIPLEKQEKGTGIIAVEGEDLSQQVKGKTEIDIISATEDIPELNNVFSKFKSGAEFSKINKVASRFGKAPNTFTVRETELMKELIKKDLDSINFIKLGKMVGEDFTDEFGKDFFELWQQVQKTKTSKPLAINAQGGGAGTIKPPTNVAKGVGEGGEQPVKPEFSSTSKSFNKHIDYFQERQIPKDSQLRVLQKNIQRVNGQRLSGKLTPQQANKQIAQLREKVFQVAQREGIAVRMTEGGKLKLAVRESGVYVPEKFAKYKNFQDVTEYMGGSTDITRLIQQIDGSLSVKKKLELEGQAGQAEQEILWTVRDISIQKMDYTQEKIDKLARIFHGVKPNTAKDVAINDALRGVVSTDADVMRRAGLLRNFYDEVIEEQNAARELRNQKPIPYRENYSPEILRDATIWERMMAYDKKDVVTTKDLPDYINPNKPFNPREQARKGNIKYEDTVKSALELAQNYIPTASKDIFNTAIIENNKAFIQELETLGFPESAKTITRWTNEAYAGVRPALDRAVKLTPKLSEGARIFNRIRNIAIFPFNFSWSVFTQTSSVALTTSRYGVRNNVMGLVDWMRPSIRKEVSEKYYSYKVKTQRQGRVTSQDTDNALSGRVKVYKTPMDVVRDASTIFLEETEKLLTGSSIRAAYRDGKRRGLKGKALDEYASDGGGKTQSMYNDEDKPALLRSLLTKTATPFQTFNYEVMNTVKEWMGKTGTPPDDQKERIWRLIRFLAAANMFKTLAHKAINKDVWSWKRPPLPFAEIWWSPVVKKLTGEYSSGGGLPSPVETSTRIAKGINDVLEVGSWDRLRRELIKYGPGLFKIPGGVGISRAVDAAIAYSKGGVFDRSGKLMFKVKEEELIPAAFSGVYTTEGGREYLEAIKGDSSFQKFLDRKNSGGRRLKVEKSTSKKGRRLKVR